MRECKRFYVHGRVQGVFFRASTQEQAERLGITGWAVNLANGSVEVLACGDGAALVELERWLQQGPPMAAVSRVEVQAAPGMEPSGSFTIS